MSASPSAAAGDDLAGLFGSLAPALAPFSAGPLGVRSAEDIISQLEEFAEFPGVQDEIDRYIEGGLVERGSVSLGTTPPASISIDRFESVEGAAADFPLRQPSCDELPLPGTALADVVVKRCNAPNANDLYVMAHRGDRVVTLQVLELPDDQAIEPVVATLTDMFRAIDPLLTL